MWGEWFHKISKEETLKFHHVFAINNSASTHPLLGLEPKSIPYGHRYITPCLGFC